MSIYGWIGEEINTSGSYGYTAVKNLSIRMNNPKQYTLYKFYDICGNEYFISDTQVIIQLEKMLKDEVSKVEIMNYIMGLIVQKYGAMRLFRYHKELMDRQYREGFRDGKKEVQDKMREALGLRGGSYV